MFQSEFTILRAAFESGHVWVAVLFVAFLVTIFAGFLVHIAKLVLGPDPGLPPADTCAWKKHSLLGLAGVVIVMGFWLPAPIYSLIQGAAQIVLEVR
jgi:hydrogenase-4 component F